MFYLALRLRASIPSSSFSANSLVLAVYDSFLHYNLTTSTGNESQETNSTFSLLLKQKNYLQDGEDDEGYEGCPDEGHEVHEEDEGHEEVSALTRYS